MQTKFFFKSKPFLRVQGSSNRWNIIRICRKMRWSHICSGIWCGRTRKMGLVKFIHCLTSGMKASQNRSSANVLMFSSVLYRSLFSFSTNYTLLKICVINALIQLPNVHCCQADSDIIYFYQFIICQFFLLICQLPQKYINQKYSNVDTNKA